MKRVPILCAGYLLVMSLLFSAAVDGFLKTSHEIARGDLTTIVICAQDGPKAVTLNRYGNPVEPANFNCAHCPDCSLVAVFDLPTIAALGRNVSKGRSIARADVKTMLVEQLVRLSSRDPPETYRL